MQASPFNFRNHMFSVGPTDLDLHENLMPCIIFGRGSPVRVTHDFGQTEAPIICIKPNVSHEVSIGRAGAEIVYLDGLQLPAEAPAVGQLEQGFETLPVAMVGQDTKLVHQLRTELENDRPAADPAIMEIVHRLYQPSIDRMSQNTLSEYLGLERTQALRHFKANTGQTFRKFKIWAAAVSTIHRAFSGLGIGLAGIDSGFSDAAHVARTSRILFGMTPTSGLQNLSRAITL